MLKEIIDRILPVIICVFCIIGGSDLYHKGDKFAGIWLTLAGALPLMMKSLC